MSIKAWWQTEKGKAKAFKKGAGKWIGIALAAILAALLIYGIVSALKRKRLNAEASKMEAETAALRGGGGRVRRLYTAPISLEGGGVGWRMMGGQRIVPA